LDSTLTDGVADLQRNIRDRKSLQDQVDFSTNPQADLRKTFATSFLDR
jgi:hypothetical protein